MRKTHNLIKQAVARGWCYPKTEKKVMDVDLVEAISLEVLSFCKQFQAENEKLKLEFARLKNWANDEDETDGFDISDFIDHINSVVKTALEGR